jgi:hypothetical protein
VGWAVNHRYLVEGELAGVFMGCPVVVCQRRVAVHAEFAHDIAGLYMVVTVSHLPSIAEFGYWRAVQYPLQGDGFSDFCVHSHG